MPGHRIRRSSAVDPQGAGDPSSNSIRVDSSTEELVYGTGAIAAMSGAEKRVLASDIPGSAMGFQEIKKFATALADATATDFNVACVVSVPNQNLVGAVEVELVGALGDQDSAEASFWTIAISRIAGAAVKAVVSAKGNAANTAGVTANAAGAITVVVAGGVGAVNTINIKVTVTRSAGASTTHDAFARLTLLNIKSTGGGLTIT